MKNKGTVLITGGAKRVGGALALALAKAGYNIALHYHASARQAQRLAKTIKKTRQNVWLFRCDLSSEDAALKLIGQVKKACPGLNVLIHNASVFKPSKISTSPMRVFHENFNVHFQAPYILSKNFARLCKKGNIINILDTSVTRNQSACGDYLLSKKALAQLSRMLAVELAPKIRVNAIAPGLILPPEGKPAAYLEKRANNIPLKRRGKPEHIIQTALFLLKNDFITGETIFCDGGEHLI